MRPLSLLVVAALLASCAPSAPPPALLTSTTAAADRIDGATARALVHAGATLVDVRSPDEYAEKHVDGAVNIPVDDVTSHDFGGKDRPIVLYCQHGPRSQRAGKALRSRGYTRVYVFGPMSAWGP